MMRWIGICLLTAMVGLCAGQAAAFRTARAASPAELCEDDACDTEWALGFDRGEHWCIVSPGTGCDNGRGTCTTYSCRAAPEGDEETRSVRHPVRDALPPADGPGLAVAAGPPGMMDEERQRRWAMLRDAIVEARPGPVLGADGDGTPIRFRRIVDVELDGNGNVYVLDSFGTYPGRRRIVVFDSTGARVGDVDVGERRPGDEGEPRQLALLNGDRLMVARHGGQVSLFSQTADGFEPDRDGADAGGRLDDICAAGGRVFVAGRDQRRAVLALPLAPGQQRESFGDTYDYGSAVARQALSVGMLACLEDPVRVVFAFRAVPRLDAYTETGTPIWTAGVADYAQGWFVEETGPYPAVSAPENYPRENLARLLPISTDFLLAAYTRSQSVEEEVVETRTYLMDAETGRGSLVSDRLPLIGAIRGDTYVTVRQDGGSTLQLWRMPASVEEAR